MEVVDRSEPVSLAHVAQDALDALHTAENRYAPLRQPLKATDDGLEQEAARQTPFAKVAAAFIKSRDSLNAMLRDECEAARRKARTSTREFLQALFGWPLDSPVTLPDDRGSDHSELVLGLASVRVDHGGIHGFVRTSSQGGKSFDTRRFYERDGRFHFADHDLM